MAENGNGSLPKPWGEMTEDEQQAYLAERKRQREEGGTPARRTRRRRNAEARQAVAQLETAPVAAYVPLGIDAEPELIAVPIPDVPVMDRVSLLMGLDPKLAAKLTDEDIEEILREEQARAEAEEKQKAMKEARDEIRARMRAERGLIDAATLRTREQNERLRQKVRIRFDLPGNGAGHQGRNGIRVDGRLYETKQWHTIPVAMLESFREMHYNTWVNEVQFTTLDQASRFGITTMNRLQGTTPAKAIFAQSPHLIEVQDAAE